MVGLIETEELDLANTPHEDIMMLLVLLLLDDGRNDGKTLTLGDHPAESLIETSTDPRPPPARQHPSNMKI